MTGFTITQEMIAAVKEWRMRRENLRIARPIVPLLIDEFGVTPLQAIAVVKVTPRDGGADASAS